MDEEEKCREIQRKQYHITKDSIQVGRWKLPSAEVEIQYQQEKSYIKSNYKPRD